MTTNPLARHGGLSYLQIPANDAKASAAFYEAVVGWRTHEDGRGVWKFDEPAGFLIGRWSITLAPAAPGFLPHFYVSDVRAAVARAVKAGGAVVKAPHPEGDTVGAQLRDPAGNVLGVWQFA